MTRDEVIDHIMKINPPEQVRVGVMTPKQWADTFLSNEPGGYVVVKVDPRVMNLPLEPGIKSKVDAYTAKDAKSAPPIVVDSNEKQQARFGGGKLDQAYGLQSHTVIDGKHRTAAAIARGDKEITAIVPERRVKEIRQASHNNELVEFVQQYTKNKDITITSLQMTPAGPRVTAKTKEGLDRQYGPTDLERIAGKTGYDFKFKE